MSKNSAQHPVRRALFAALLAGIALSCLASCSKSAPETPMERSRVLLRLFGSLDRKANEEALGHIDTYRNLDPTNMFLSDFEHIVRANGVIASARAKLEAGDLDGAAADLDAYCLKYGDVSKPISEAKAKVDLLLEAGKLNRKLLAAEFSEDIRKAANELEAFAKNNAALFPDLPAYADAKIKEADALAIVEKTDACVFLFQDALDASVSGRKEEAAALIALLELNADSAQITGFESWLAAPEHPVNQ